MKRLAALLKMYISTIFAALVGRHRMFTSLMFTHRGYIFYAVGSIVVMFTVNLFTENFALTGLAINRTETGNMATALSAKQKLKFCALKK